MSVWSMRMVQPRRGGDAPRRGPIPFSTRRARKEGAPITADGTIARAVRNK